MQEDVNQNSDNKQYHKSGAKDLFEISTVILASIFSGFVLGLLFAPQSGFRTRKIVAEKVKGIVDRIKFTLAEARVIGEDLLDKSKKKVDEVSNIIRSEDEEKED